MKKLINTIKTIRIRWNNFINRKDRSVAIVLFPNVEFFMSYGENYPDEYIPGIYLEATYCITITLWIGSFEIWIGQTYNIK